MAIRKGRIRKRKIIKPAECYYCKNRTWPDYKNIEDIRRFVSDRGRIIGSMYSGLCQKHQRLLTKSVKRARFLALLPFVARPY